MPGPSGERCDGCYYWHHDRASGFTDDDTEHSDCLRFPPTTGSHKDVTRNFTARFPVTLAYDWCGEYRTRGEAPEPAPASESGWGKFVERMRTDRRVWAAAIYATIHDRQITGFDGLTRMSRGEWLAVPRMAKHGLKMMAFHLSKNAVRVPAHWYPEGGYELPAWVKRFGHPPRETENGQGAAATRTP